MNALIIDLTHSGFTLALEFSQNNSLFNEIWAWDIYKTITEPQKEILKQNNIKLINKMPERSKLDNFCIIAPVHCPLDLKTDFTHHQAVNLILKSWKDKRKIPIIEVTGVKGKTSVVGILKEIFSYKNPLILSSLGATVSNSSEKILKKDISITPASIIETVKLSKDHEYKIGIFESSLGGTGLADVGVLTNIAENYPIAQGKSNASKAKSQIFASTIICCDYDTLNEFYSDLKDDIKEKMNTFSLNKAEANLYAYNIKYQLNKTSFQIKANNMKTINGEILNCSFSVETFAPAPHHVNNVLAAVCAALSLNIHPSRIKKGLENFSGLEGRSSIKIKNNSTIIEEINPGINIRAIEKTIDMAQDMDEPFIILGGEYGVTCEEIDEKKAALLLDNLLTNDDSIKKSRIILTDELGKTIHEKMKIKLQYIDNPQEAVDYAIKENKNIIFIFRSNYSNLKLR